MTGEEKGSVTRWVDGLRAGECRRLFDSLPDESVPQIVTLKFEGYTDREIAGTLNCGLSTIERRPDDPGAGPHGLKDRCPRSVRSIPGFHSVPNIRKIREVYTPAYTMSPLVRPSSGSGQPLSFSDARLRT